MLLLRSYSHYSLLSAVPKIKDLVLSAKSKGYSAIALTDEDNTSGLVEFQELCQKNEINGILGVTLRISNLFQSSDDLGRNPGFSKIAILAKNLAGYKAILELTSVARVQKENPVYHIDLEDLLKYLVVDSENGLKTLPFYTVLAGVEHEYGQNFIAGRSSVGESVLDKYKNAIGENNLIVETLIKNDKNDESLVKKVNKELDNYCKKLNLELKYSPAPRYLEDTEKEAFQVLLAIKKQIRIYDITVERNFDLPAAAFLSEKFIKTPDLLDFTKIIDNCDCVIRTNYDKYASEAFFPYFPLPNGQTTDLAITWESYIGLIDIFSPIERSQEEWRQIYPYEKLEQLKEACKHIKPDTNKLLSYSKDYWDQKSMADYIERIEKELDIINTKGYPSYFLVVSDIMMYCRKNGIVISTRGSAAGSLVAYLTGINILDPLIYDIPFERFLNPFRPSAPDIDGDFADDRRAEVIEYLVEKYGRENVSLIVTYGTMLPRAAVRDIGRVLGVSYRKCDQLSKLIPTPPQGRKATFAWAMETSTEFKQVYENDEEVTRIIDIGKKLEGNHRHASTHAAGLVITPTKITDYTAVQWDSDHKQVACQYDMRVGEKVGLVKMDLLGITNLSILGNAIVKTKERRGVDVDLYNLNLNDKKTFELLSAGRTMGLFQLSGPAMTKYLVQLEPSKVQDLMAMVALYRPGPMANIPDYIKRKKDHSLITYPVPQMKEWMEESYGILVYQDDLLYMTIRLAGYDWGEADTFRKGVGKKIKEILDAQQERFVGGCVTHSGIDRAIAQSLWDIMVPFAAYGFNKAHSANYGMVAYWTAYMKANFPVEFMTALMTSEEGNMEKIGFAIKECIQMGINVLPPDINTSNGGYTIVDDQTIRYGLGSVKNLGSDVIKFIIKERDENGAYTDMNQFLDRISTFPQFNKRSLEALIVSGAFDILGGIELVNFNKS